MFTLLSTSSPAFLQKPQYADPVPVSRVRNEKLPSSRGSPSMIYRGTRFDLPPVEGNTVLKSALKLIYRGTVAFFRRGESQNAVPTKRAMIYRGTSFTM